MANSPLKQDLTLVSFSVLIDGKEVSGEYHITEIEVKHEINKIPVASFVVLDGDPADVEMPISEGGDFVPGKSVKITAGYHQKEETIFEGVIASHGSRIPEDEMSELMVNCVATAAKMTTNRKNEYFAEMKDSEVIQKIIGNNGLSATVDATDAKHECVVQYDCTDWDMIVMRADLHGLVVVVDDKKVNVKKIETGSPVLELTHGTDIISNDLSVDARYQYSKVTNKTWDMASNKVITKSSSEPSIPKAGNLTGTKMADVLGTGEFLMHSVGVFDQEEIKAMADARLLRSRLSLIRGKVKFVGHAAPKPNTTITLKGMSPRLNGDVYVSGVHHVLKDTSWDTEVTIGMAPTTFAESNRDVMVPNGSGMIPGINGVQIGVVQKIHDDPENSTRILVDVPMIAESGVGIWARQALYYGTNGAGNFFMPEIGDEVLLAFVNGDPRYPIIIGSVYSAKHPPAYTPDAPNTYKAITTNSKMKIEFEDVKKIITIWTPAGNFIEINDDKKTITIKDETGNECVTSPDGVKWKTPKEYIIEATGNISIKSNASIKIEATGSMSSKAASIAAEAQGSHSIKGAQVSINGSAMVEVKGGLVKIN